MKLSEILEAIDHVEGKLVIVQPKKETNGDKLIGIQDVIRYQDTEVDHLSTYGEGSLLIMLKNNKGGELNETT